MKNSLQIYSRLLNYAKPYWKIAIAMLVATSVYASTNAFYVSKIKIIMDEGFINENLSVIKETVIILVFVTLIRGIGFFIGNYSARKISSDIVFDLRKQMFLKLGKLPSSFYHKESSGNILSKFNYDVLQVTDAATNVFLTLFREGILVVIILTYLFYQNWQLTIIILALLPFIAIIIKAVSKRLRKLAHGLQANMGQMNHILDENIKGQQIVKLYHSSEHENKKFTVSANRIRRANIKSEVANSLSTPIIEFLIVIALSIVIWFSALQVQEGTLTPGAFFAYIIMMGLLPSAVKKLTRINEYLQRGLAASSSIFDFLDEAIENEQSTKQFTNNVEGNIVFDHISFFYGKYPILSEFDLEIKAGETVAVVGYSGSGKTSLARLIPRFYEVQSGKITIDGQDIGQLSLQELRQQISFVGQETTLFDDTVLNNIAYGVETPDVDKAEAVAKVAFAHDFIMSLEGGYQHIIGESGQKLSGGQRQRLAIARAVYKDAPIMIFDEATSALDNKSEKLVQKALEALIKDKTAIVIAHRLSTVRHADKIVVLDNGKIKESGTHEALLAQKGQYFMLHQNTLT